MASKQPPPPPQETADDRLKLIQVLTNQLNQLESNRCGSGVGGRNGGDLWEATAFPRTTVMALEHAEDGAMMNTVGHVGLISNTTV